MFLIRLFVDTVINQFNQYLHELRKSLQRTEQFAEKPDRCAKDIFDWSAVRGAKKDGRSSGWQQNRCAQNEHIAKADGERVNRTAQAIAKEHGISREAVKRTEKIDHSPQKVKTAPGVAAPRTVIGAAN